MKEELPEYIAEIVGMPENFDFKDKTAYCGFEPSGKLHKGHANPFKALGWCADKGAGGVIFIADIHAKLNEKNVDMDRNGLSKLQDLSKTYNVLSASTLYDGSFNWEDFGKLCQKATLSRTVRTITCAGREEGDAVKMSWLNYALLQAYDIHLLNVDIAIGGIDQRKVHMLVRDIFPKLGWKVPVMIHTKIVLGADGNKMSKSNPKYCEEL